MVPVRCWYEAGVSWQVNLSLLEHITCTKLTLPGLNEGINQQIRDLISEDVDSRSLAPLHSGRTLSGNMKQTHVRDLQPLQGNTILRNLQTLFTHQTCLNLFLEAF